jgi:hypothetical protein
LALGHFSTGAAISALSAALAKDPQPQVRIDAAGALAIIGPPAKEAVHALCAALAKETDPKMRSVVVSALGKIGPATKEVIPALCAAFAKDTSPYVRDYAAMALEQIAGDARDNKRTDLIEQLAQAVQVLTAKSFTKEATVVRTAVSVLQAIQPPWYQVLYDWACRHNRLVGLVAIYVFLALLWLTLLWKAPFSLWIINEVPLLSRNVKLPDWIGGGEAKLSHVLLVGFLHYHPRVLDSWVSRHIAKARDQFSKIATVQQREVHVDVPVESDRKVVTSLKPEDLKEPLARNSARLLIWGEGGAGKTSLVCQIARCGMSEDAARRPCAHRMLPVMIEQDLNLEVGKDKVVLTEVIRGELKELTGEAEAPSQEMVRQLLKRKRVLLIVDGLSELNEATRNKIRPKDPQFAANALIVTSRLEKTLDGVTKTTLHPMRIDGKRLASFMEAYLQKCGKRELFDDPEFFEACKRLSMMVGERDTTVLLAKLYAEQMIASKEGAGENLPENILDLMLQYLNELNR